MRTIRIGTEEMLYRRLNAMFSRGTVFSIITTLLIVLGFASVSWARDVPVKVAVFLKDPPWERKVPGEAILEMLDAVEWIDAEYIYDFKKATLEDYDVLVLCQTRYHPKQKPEGWMDVLRNWVRDGHGLLVTHDAVGYRRNKPFFPNISKGTGNPYNTMEPYSTECCVARSHPVTADFVPMQRFVLSFYDFITIDPGSEGVVVVRGVDKLGDGAVSSAPVVVCAEVGKGRYVANGAYLGGLAPSGKAVQPVGAERKLLLNCIEYLAHRSPGKIEPQDSADTGDIGNGIYLGPAAIDMLENGSFENAVAGTLPPGWSVCGPSESTKAVIVSANPHSGRNCVRLSVSSKAGESDKEMHPGIVIGNMNGGEWPEVYPVFPETSYALSSGPGVAPRQTRNHRFA